MSTFSFVCFLNSLLWSHDTVKSIGEKKFLLRISDCMLCLFFVCLFYVCDLIIKKKRHHPHISLLSWLHSALQRRVEAGDPPLIKCFLSLALRSDLTKDVLCDNGVSGRALGPDPWPSASPEDRCLNTDNYCEPDAPQGCAATNIVRGIPTCPHWLVQYWNTSKCEFYMSWCKSYSDTDLHFLVRLLKFDWRCSLFGQIRVMMLLQLEYLLLKWLT